MAKAKICAKGWVYMLKYAHPHHSKAYECSTAVNAARTLKKAMAMAETSSAYSRRARAVLARELSAVDQR